MLQWCDNTTVSCFGGLILLRARSLEIPPIFPQVNVGNLGDVRIMKHDLSALDYNADTNANPVQIPVHPPDFHSEPAEFLVQKGRRSKKVANHGKT